jgi:cytidine deaminase
MPTVNPTSLVRAANRARKNAVAKHSGFQVGAALVTRRGKIITGANVESDSYGLTCCAERVALFKALTEGHKDFVAIAVVAPSKGGPMPCGACRQLLIEYAPKARVWVADSRRLNKLRSYDMGELLAHPFVFTS